VSTKPTESAAASGPADADSGAAEEHKPPTAVTSTAPEPSIEPVTVSAPTSGPLGELSDSLVSRDTLPAPLEEKVGDWRTASAESRLRSLSATMASDGTSGADFGLDDARALEDDSQELYDREADEDPLADPLIGLVVADRYRIVERIGRGGMGIVYRVQHTKIGKLLAMKLLAGELSAKQEVLTRFKREALTVSKLSSPHTVQVFDYGVWNHLTYLVMELVEGMDLGRLLKRHGPLPFSRLGRLMVQVCSSLAEAHGKGITHRDIKPENIMIIADARGVEMSKVLDFGLAKLKESAELNEVTLQGAVVGTPYYISPEQVYGEDVDGRSDVYSLGTVMFRALTGSYPFEAKTPMGMFTKHLTEAVPKADERAPESNIPLGVSSAIEKCMAKEPKDRFASIEDLRDVLLHELNALPLSSQERLLLDPARESSPSRSDVRVKAVPAVDAVDPVKAKIATRAELEAYERKLRRNRYGVWGLGLLAVAGIAAGALYLVQASKDVLAGQEREPNDTGQEANPIAFGTGVSGQLGRRIDRNTPDRDFYRLDLTDESPELVGLRVSALPNIPICALLYRQGYADPMSTYCTGVSQLDLEIPRLRLDRGAYFVAITQDLMLQAEGEARYPVENISDTYRITLVEGTARPNDEIEPNDAIPSAQTIGPGAERTGTLGWVGDRDVFCTPAAGSGQASRGRVHWSVTDGGRPEGTVLEVTPYAGALPRPLVRIHAGGAAPVGRPRLEADVNGPWMSEVQDLAMGERLCLSLELTRDPWLDGRGPTPSGTSYRVRLLRGDP